MIIQGDCLEALKEIPDNSVDQLVTDPPYGISFMGRSWDDFSKGQKKQEEMQKENLKQGKNKWGNREDGPPDINIVTAANCPIYNSEGMIEFYVPIWKEVYRVMKPGAFGFICCIPRQDCLSKMILSLEKSGFQINFSPLYWSYATGFPKGLNVYKKVEKDLTKELEKQGFENIEWEDE